MIKRSFIGATLLIVAMVMTGCGNNKPEKQEKEEKTKEATEQTAEKLTKRMMLIVDPQIDFISGSLAVKDGQKAIENLIKAFDNGLAANYDFIAITQDSHPENHCSFEAQGGVFPPHCVQGTEGQIVYPQLKESIAQNGVTNIAGFTKGELAEKEEFSIFQAEKAGKRIKELIESNDFEGIDICGIASDYCVYETLKDLLTFYPAGKVRVAMNCVAAVADNEKLPAFMKEQGVEAINF